MGQHPNRSPVDIRFNPHSSLKWVAQHHCAPIPNWDPQTVLNHGHDTSAPGTRSPGTSRSCPPGCLGRESSSNLSDISGGVSHDAQWISGGKKGACFFWGVGGGGGGKGIRLFFGGKHGHPICSGWLRFKESEPRTPPKKERRAEPAGQLGFAKQLRERPHWARGKLCAGGKPQ